MSRLGVLLLYNYMPLALNAAEMFSKEMIASTRMNLSWQEYHAKHSGETLFVAFARPCLPVKHGLAKSTK